MIASSFFFNFILSYFFIFLETANEDLSDARKSSDDKERSHGEECSTNQNNFKSNFRIKFRHSELSFNGDGRKRNKMVRFVEAKRRNCVPVVVEKPKRNCAKNVDEKLKSDDAVLFLKTVLDQPPKPEAEKNRGEVFEDGKLTELDVN